MKLLVVSGSPLDQVGGRYYAYDTWLRLVQHLSREIGGVTLWSPVRALGDTRIPERAWLVEPGGLAIEPHEHFNSFKSYYRGWPFLQRRLRDRFARLLSGHDLVVLRTPSPMSGLVMREARRQRKPVVMMVLGNLATQAGGLISHTGLMRLAFKGAVTAAILQELWCGRQAHELIVYSREIAVRHRRVGSFPKLMQDPALRLADIVPRSDTCLHDEIRIVRVCWIIPSKGLESLIDAVASLRAEGQKVVLDIVGHERTEGYLEVLRHRAAGLGIADVVHFRGWVPADAIENVYLQADIQVISSLAEGTPRCIAEGLARGVPLVCTAVGGCVDILEDGANALLVPPGDSRAIAAAVRRLTQDVNLRRRLIKAGYTIAHQATFEILGARFVSILHRVVETQGRLVPECFDLTSV